MRSYRKEENIMTAKNNFFVLLVIFIMLAVAACNLPTGVAPANQGPADSNTATPTATFTAIAVDFSETPSPTTAAEACKPTVITSVVANVRSGPGQVYGVIGSLPQGGSANVAGKSYDGTWWYIEFAAGTGGFAWISSTVTTPACIPTTLASIVAPPTPIVPTDVPVAVAPASPTTVSGGGSGIHLYPINPGLILINSPTPTKIKLQINPGLIQPIKPILPVGP
jgi:hypothetical protein